MLARVKNSKPLQLTLILAAAILVVFGQTVFFSFIALDDSKHIWSNNYVNTLSFKHLKFFWEQPYYGLYIPIIYNTWTFLAELTQAIGLKHPVSGYSAHFFHFTNVTLHLFNTFLVFQLFRYLLTKRPALGASNSQMLLATIAAGLFAIHPLQVEPVAWASGLKDVLSTSLALISMVLFFIYYQLGTPSIKKTRKQKTTSQKAQVKNTPEPELDIPRLFQVPKRFTRTKWVFFLSFVFFILALFAKPSVVVLPAVLFVLVAFWMNDQKRLRPLVLFFAAVVPVVWMTKSLQPNARLDFTLEIWQYPLIALHALGFYVSKILLPVDLAPDYGLSPDVALASSGFFGLVALGLVPVCLLIIAAIKNQTPLMTGFLIFLIGLLPVMGFVPFEYQNMSTVADRYLYFIPFFGLGLVVVTGLQKMDEKSLKTATGIIAVSLMIVSIVQTRHWMDNARLFARVLEVNPNSYLSLNNMGLVHLRAGDFPPAEAYFEKALKIKPDYTAAQSNLGVVYFKQKLYAKVIEHYTAILKDKPNLTAGASATFADMHYNLGAALLNSGQIEKSITHLEKAAEININHFAAQFHRGRVYAHIKNLEKAKEAFLQAYRINPKSSDVIEELKKLRAQGVSF